MPSTYAHDASKTAQGVTARRKQTRKCFMIKGRRKGKTEEGKEEKGKKVRKI
jgi:hypothetical protein